MHFVGIYFNSLKNSRNVKLSGPSPLGSPRIIPRPQDGLGYHYSPVFRVKHRTWAPERDCFQLERPPAGHPCRHSACSIAEAPRPPERPGTKGHELLTCCSQPDPSSSHLSLFLLQVLIIKLQRGKVTTSMNSDLGPFCFSGLFDQGKIKHIFHPYRILVLRQNIKK